VNLPLHVLDRNAIQREMHTIGAAPCTAMVFVWSQLCKGDPYFTLSQVALNHSIMILAFAPLIALLLGLSTITIPWDTLIISVGQFFNSSLAYILNRRLGVAHCVAGPSSLISASNFFELPVTTEFSLFGFHSDAALATVVGVFIEVPMMLFVVGIANSSKHSYESNSNVKRRAV
jgi:arsenite transporter